MHARFVRIVLGLIGIVAVSSDALAQDHDDDNKGYIAGKLGLGLGGAATIDVEDQDAGEDDMKASYGLGVAYIHALHDYFALGAQVAAYSWTTKGLDADRADRSVLIDFSLVLQGKNTFGDSFEVYAAVPFGFTLDFFSEARFADMEVSGGSGFNAGLFLGVRAMLGERWGLLAETGYSYHAFAHSLKAFEEELDVDVSFGQFGVNLGAYSNALN